MITTIIATARSYTPSLFSIRAEGDRIRNSKLKTNNSDWKSPIFWVLIFAALMIIRSPALFIAPRFWAEEATHFYALFSSDQFIGALLHVHIGSYQLMANMMVFLATIVPLSEAPTVTTYLAFLVQMVVVYQIGVFIRENKLSTLTGLLLLIGFSLQWGMYEISLTATNAQWVTGLSALMILTLPCVWLDKNIKTVGPWLLICGLSGVPAALVAPAFALKAFLFRSRSTAISAGILFFCAAVQLGCVLWFGTPGRSFTKSLAVLAMPTIMQTAVEPFTGPEPIFLVGSYISGALPKVGMLLFSTITIGIAIFASTLFLAWNGVKDKIVFVIFFSWIYISLAQTIGAIHSSELITASGARYYVFGVSAMCLLLSLGTKCTEKGLRSIAVCCLALISVAGIGQWIFGTWTSSLTNGPSWKNQLANCKQGEICTLRTWPDDGAWYVIVDGRKIHSSYYPVKLPALQPGK